ncbi:hypothetical protein [Phenylobacterium sp.]|uniref:hypothetical protein n=1 Tax=Phenylobacterium sp. TaxID=1871053 RepID=UPI002DE5D3E9|nr:hypothetical protein [Phenylobacterium sp.]
MAIGREDAERALKDAADAAGRSHRLAGYRGASGFLLLWGLIWAVADVAAYLNPMAGNWAWLLGDVIGVAGSVALGMRMKSKGPSESRWRGVGSALLIAAAIAMLAIGISIISPLRSAAQSQAMAGLAAGCAYVVLGANQGLRIAAVGAAMIALTLGGWLFAHEQFLLWMAAAGGGGLVLGGLWLRTV